MIVVTTESICGKKIVKTLGLVRGNTVRVRHIGRDLAAGLKTPYYLSRQRRFSRFRT